MRKTPPGPAEDAPASARSPASAPSARDGRRDHRDPHGFTLVEILIVVVILGVLAAIVLPQLSAATVASEQTAFVSSLKSFVQADQAYYEEFGAYFEDTSSGTPPAMFDRYFDDRDWERLTPIGGVWDSEVSGAYGSSAIGVHFDGSGATRDDAYMTEVDDLLDDGDLATGSFQRIEAARYYFVVE